VPPLAAVHHPPAHHSSSASYFLIHHIHHMQHNGTLLVQAGHAQVFTTSHTRKTHAHSATVLGTNCPANYTALLCIHAAAAFLSCKHPVPASSSNLLALAHNQHYWSLSHTCSAPRRAGLCCLALLGSRNPGVWPYTEAGVPALPPCCRAPGAVCDTTLFARLSLGDTGCCCCCCWCAWPCGEAGCTAVEIRLLLGRWKRPREGRE
jgi:hypothetical protein